MSRAVRGKSDRELSRSHRSIADGVSAPRARAHVLDGAGAGADAWWQATRVAREAFQLTGFGDAFGVKLLSWCLDEWAAAEERVGDAESAGEIRTERRVLETDYDRWLRDNAIR